MSPRKLSGTLVLIALALPAWGEAAAPAAAAKPAPRSAATASTKGKAVPAAKMVLPFIDDDYDRARNEARERRIPIFIENWAPW